MNAQGHTWEQEAKDIKQKYEEILTSLDYTFEEIKEQAERILRPNHPYDTAGKRATNILGLIDSRSKY